MCAAVFDRFLSTPEIVAVFGENAVVQSMLDFEAALARAQAAEGVIPAAAAQAIAGVCKAELFDVTALVAASARAGSLAIPLIDQLTETVARFDGAAAGYVHWGSTSQDAIDTALVLQTRRALALIDRDLSVLIDALQSLATRHAGAPMLARTLMQPAQVVSVDFKLVGWIAPLVRCQQRLREVGHSALQLQLGGAVGTLAVLGAHGAAVARRMADALQLAAPPLAWHTQRDALASLSCEVGVLTGALGKIARDISLLAQGEVAELAEAADGRRGGSSTMPHKRNPVGAMVALAAALRVPQRVAALLAAMVQEHERGLGNWQAELAESAGLYSAAHGAVNALADAAGGLEVDVARMRRNIDALHGVVFAESVAMRFATRIGKARAHVLLERLSNESVNTQRHLRELTLQELSRDDALGPLFDAKEVAALFEPEPAAHHASQLARPQLEALSRQARSLAESAPWAVWLVA